MIYYVIILFLICSWGLTIRVFQTDYMSIEKTTSTKGIFTFLIFLSHAMGYCTSAPTNDIGIRILTFLGQMVVVMFLFYSGFGIMEQYGRRGGSYLKSFPKKRILKLLLHFDLAVLLFLFVQLLLGNTYPLSYYFLCWIGWTSIGNSAWFIFDMLLLYLISYLTLLLIEKHSVPKITALIFLIFLSFLLWLFLWRTKSGSTWWYNTIFAFPLGAVYSQIRSKVDAIHLKMPGVFALSVCFCSLLWVVSRRSLGIDQYGLSAVLFSSSVVGVTSFVSTDNPILRWLGKNCFYIYILQRVPMIILSHFSFNRFFILFILCSFVLTILLVLGFRKITDTLDRLWFQ